MTTLRRSRLLANSASIFAGETAARLATSLLAVVIAHAYGPVALGEYGYAVALASVLLIVPDLGLHLYMVRELSPAPGRLREIFWGAHWLKFVLTGGVLLLAAVIGRASIADPGARLLFHLLIGRALLQTFAQAAMAVFKAFERMQPIALQQGVNAAVVLLWTGAALALEARLPWMVAGLAAGQLVETLVAWGALRRRFSPGRPVRWNGRRLYAIAAASFPIGGAAVLLALNVRIDLLVLGYYASPHELGQFQAAAWFATAAFLASSLLMAVLFPRLSRLLPDGTAAGGAYVDSLLKNGLLAAALASLALWLAAPALVPGLFGPAFAPAAGLLRRLTPALPSIFLNTALFYVFVAAGRRRVYTGTLAFGVGLGALLGAFLAPRYGPAGAAAAAVGRELAVSGVYLHCLGRGRCARRTGRALRQVFLGTAALLVLGATGSTAGSDLWLAAWMVSVVAGTLILLGLPQAAEWRRLIDDHP